MESNKLEAEAKIIAKKFGGNSIGLSWMRALRSEFKKPYIQEVRSEVTLVHHLSLCTVVSLERGC